eukprot:gene11399-12100_t
MLPGLLTQKSEGMKLDEQGDNKVAGHYYRVTQGWRALFNEPDSFSPFFRAIVDDKVHFIEQEIGNKPELLNQAITVLFWGENDGEASISTSCSVKSRTPLMVAAYHGALRVLSLLLSKGADTSPVSDMGTAEELASCAEENVQNKEIVLAMLKDASANRHALDPEVSAPTSHTNHFSFGDNVANPSDGAKNMPYPVVGSSPRNWLPPGQTSESSGNTFQRGGAARFSTSELTRVEYANDTFRLFSFKCLRCSKRYAHDWRACPFAHPTENARRRDPREFHYCATACPDYKQGFCSRGDLCCFAHGVYECWLHPSRYRTQLCKDGPKCRRPVCFFAHNMGELRSPSHNWSPTPDFLLAMPMTPFTPNSSSQADFSVPHSAGTTTSQVTASSPHPPQPMVPGQVHMTHFSDEPLGLVSHASLAGETRTPQGGAAASTGRTPEAATSAANNNTFGSSLKAVAISSGGFGASANLGDMQASCSGTDSPDTANNNNSSGSRAPGRGMSSTSGLDEHSTPSHDTPLTTDSDSRNSGAYMGGRAGSAGGMTPNVTLPRMSNEYARRHGLNPKDNAMVNAQKIKLQQGRMGGQGYGGRGGDGSGRQGKPYFMDPSSSPQHYGMPGPHHMGPQAAWPHYLPQQMPDVNYQQQHQQQMDAGAAFLQCHMHQSDAAALSSNTTPDLRTFFPPLNSPLYHVYGSDQSFFNPAQSLQQPPQPPPHPPAQQQHQQQQQHIAAGQPFGVQDQHHFTHDPQGLSSLAHMTQTSQLLPGLRIPSSSAMSSSINDPSESFVALSLEQLEL